MNDPGTGVRDMTSATAVGGFSELVRAALRRRRIVFWTPVLAGLLVVLGIGAVWPSVSWLPRVGIELPAATSRSTYVANSVTLRKPVPRISSPRRSYNSPGIFSVTARRGVWFASGIRPPRRRD